MKQSKLPDWFLRELADPNAKENLQGLDEVACKIARHVQNINTNLEQKYIKEEPVSKVIVLGMDFLQESAEIKVALDEDDTTLEGYLLVMSQVFEGIERWVDTNSANLWNPVLMKHTKGLIRQLVQDTRALEIVNPILGLFQEYNEPEPPAPRCA